MTGKMPSKPISVGHRQPRLAVDCIVRCGDRLLLIERRNEPHGLALPGGLVDYGETVEEAVRREIVEETGLKLRNLSQFRVYSDPNRDPRGHCVSVVFAADGAGAPRAGDDAGSVVLVEPEAIPFDRLAFDHAQVLRDYLASDASGRDQAG